MHNGNIKTSGRLQRVAKVLSDGNWHSTQELGDKGFNYCPGTVVSELRRNNLTILSRCTGRGRYEYQLQTQSKGMDL
jgi:hypothetical protein